MKARRLCLAGFLLALGVGCSRSGGGSAPGGLAFPGAPVVLISIDTLRSDHLPAYGYTKVETPHLDALRKDSILFGRAYSHCPLTFPSHVSILTGLLPSEHQVRDNVGYLLDPKAHPTLAARLHAAGYATGAVVSAWVLRGATGLAGGFDFYDDEIERPQHAQAASEVQRPGGESAARALAFLDRTAGKPFFLLLHLYEPHSPYTPPEPFRSRYPLAYDGEIATVDAIVGDFLAGLKKRELYDRSIVLLLSDHGEGLSDHGEEEHGILLYREALQVPLFVKLPGAARGGSRVDAPVQLIDVVPTLADLLRIPRPEGLKGTNLLGPAPSASAIVAESYYPRIHLGWSDLHSVLDGRHHFIEGTRRELYDLDADPGERDDLFERKGDVARALKRELDRQPSRFALPAAIGAEEMKKLTSLGYLAGASSSSQGPLPDPRESLPVLAEMKTAFRLAADGKDAEASGVLKKVLAKNPGMFDAQYELAETLARLKRYEEAADAYKAALRISPSLAGEIALALGRVLFELGRFDEASANAELAVIVNPGEAHYLHARTSLAQNDLARAEREADLAAADPRAAAEAAVVKAEVLLRRNAVAEALAVLEKTRAALAAEKKPSVGNLEFLRGDGLARFGRHTEAEAAFREEIRAYPKNSQAYSGLAVLLAVQHHTRSEVHGLLESMYRANPSPATARLAEKTLDSLEDHAGATRWAARGRSPSAASR